MAIRVRRVDGTLVALCAAKTDEVDGDIYLNDEVHYALSQKYWRDYEEIDIVDDEGVALATRLESSD